MTDNCGQRKSTLSDCHDAMFPSTVFGGEAEFKCLAVSRSNQWVSPALKMVLLYFP